MRSEHLYLPVLLGLVNNFEYDDDDFDDEQWNV